MGNVTINLPIPALKLSAKAHQRIVAASSLLAAIGVVVTAYGPGFGLPAADAVYASSAVNVIATILNALSGRTPPVEP